MLNNRLVINNLQIFSDRYGQAEITVIAPGRVNIMGEHTDYNGGDVLPFAIHKSLILSGKSSNKSLKAVYSSLFDEEVNLDSDLKPTHWSRFLIDAIKTLENKGFKIGGFELVVGGDLIHGAGMSSSSALCCGFLHFLSHIFDLKISKVELVDLASITETKTGVVGGIMDQTTIVNGQKDHFLHIDCSQRKITKHKIHLKNHDWLLIDSGEKHNLVETEYNSRNIESKEALQIAKNQFPDIQSYRNLNQEHLDYLKSKSPTLYKRAKHFVDEQIRVKQMLINLQNQNFEEAGSLLYQCHQSLKNLYQVSCTEIDFIVNHLKSNPIVCGARMMGGGFGGSVICLIKKGGKSEILEKLGPIYSKQFNKKLNGYLVQPADGLKAICHE